MANAEGYRVYWSDVPGIPPAKGFVDVGAAILTLDVSGIAGIGTGARYFNVATLNGGLPGKFNTTEMKVTL